MLITLSSLLESKDLENRDCVLFVIYAPHSGLAPSRGLVRMCRVNDFMKVKSEVLGVICTCRDFLHEHLSSREIHLFVHLHWYSDYCTVLLYCVWSRVGPIVE